MDLFAAVQSTIKEELGTIAPLPSFLEPTVGFLQKIHLYYRSYRFSRTIQDAASEPAKGNPLAYGAALHVAADYTSFGFAITAALAAKCAFDLLTEYRHVQACTTALWSAVRGEYPVFQSVQWHPEKNRGFSLLQQVKTLHLLAQIKRIKDCVMALFWQIFQLSMCMADAYLILTGDAAARLHGYTELAAEWMNYHGKLDEDKERLLIEIEKSSALIDRLLIHLHAPETCLTLTQSLKAQVAKLAKKSEGILDGVVSVAETILDPIYVPGKITPLHVDFSEGKDAPPTLPPGRFPPWAGQKVTLAPLATATKKEDLFDWKEIVESALLNNPLLPIGSTFKHLSAITSAATDLIKEQLAQPSTSNPFA